MSCFLWQPVTILTSPEPTSVTEGSEFSPFWLQEEQLKELEVLNPEKAFKRHMTAGFIHLKGYKYGRLNGSCTQRTVVDNEGKLYESGSLPNVRRNLPARGAEGW